MSLFIKYLPLFIPLIIVQLILAVTAVIHILKHPVYRFGNKVMWIIVVVFGEIIGPVIYFIFGRGEE